MKTAVGLLCGTTRVPDGERRFLAKGSKDMIRKVDRGQILQGLECQARRFQLFLRMLSSC